MRFSPIVTQEPQLKPRIVVITDISTWETDDNESLIRLLVQADMFEIEGLIFSTGYSVDKAGNLKKFLDLIYYAGYARSLNNQFMTRLQL
ncbi:MAG: DUF1593 domain-containing protein [Spirochaetales bacterium]|nr:DUF1593 domain-containing protein [Spirochaetales bacterium]